MNGILEKRYKMESEGFANSFTDEQRKKISESWFDKKSAGMWRFRKAYAFLDNFFDKNASWLTVGDGRWGLDAINIMERGFKKVMATDISETLLKASKEKKLIPAYSVQNAEKLTFPDDSFDYVFCKEAFHHFPRPYIALYEMLRVAKKGVFLIEPSDQNVFFQNYMQGAVADGKQHIPLLQPTYEGVGNYVYKFSAHEAFKVAYGLNLPQMLISGYNDHYVEGIEFEPIDAEKSAIFRITKEIIEAKDEAVKLGHMPYDMIMVGIMKESLDGRTARAFDKNDWKIFNLTRNPHI